MLIQMIVMANESLQFELEPLKNHEDVQVNFLSKTEQEWSRIMSTSGDLFILEQQCLAISVEQAIADIKSLPDNPVPILIANNADSEHVAHWVGLGCEAVLDANLSGEQLIDSISGLIQKKRESMVSSMAMERDSQQVRLEDFVSNSPKMNAFVETVRQVIDSDVTLLLQGETGTGKERIARAIHRASKRSSGPFVAVNCGALPESILESELFGHEKGAFTGAYKMRRGCFEVAHRGILFLDEIGEMPRHLQVKLLRVLQERVIQRLGGEEEIMVDVRILAATHRNLEKEIALGNFRQDLFYRLSVVQLPIPPLRERKEDIPQLVHSYLQHYNKTMGKIAEGIDDQAMEALVYYTWPGNVRELMNMMERAVLLCKGSRLNLQDFPVEVTLNSATLPSGNSKLFPSEQSNAYQAWVHMPYKEAKKMALRNLDAAYFHHCLDMSKGSIKEAERRSGIPQRSIYNHLKNAGLDKMAFKKTT